MLIFWFVTAKKNGRHQSKFVCDFFYYYESYQYFQLRIRPCDHDKSIYEESIALEINLKLNTTVIDLHRMMMKEVVGEKMGGQIVLWIGVKNTKGRLLTELLHTDKKCLGQILVAKNAITYHLYVRQVSYEN